MPTVFDGAPFPTAKELKPDWSQILSYSRMSAECYKREFDGRNLNREGPLMDMGKLRHRALELHENSRSITIKACAESLRGEYPNLSDKEVQTAIDQVSKISPHDIPDSMLCFSVEGSDLPKEITTVIYGKPMLTVPLGCVPVRDTTEPGVATVLSTHDVNVWIRGIIDLSYMPTPTRVVARDWKGADPRSERNELQARIIFLLLLALVRQNQWKGIEQIDVEFVGVPTMTKDTFQFFPEDEEPVTQYVIGRASEYLSARALYRGTGVEGPASPGGECYFCVLAGTPECPATLRALEANMAALVPKLGVGSLETPDLCNLYEVAYKQKSIADGIAKRVREEIKLRMDGSSVIHGGKEYYMTDCEKTVGLKPQETMEFLMAHGADKTELFNFAGFILKTCKDFYEQLRRSIGGKGSQAIKKALKSEWEKCLIVNEYQSFKSRIVKEKRGEES